MEVPDHLVSMITILLEEERAENKNEEKANYQPCLEYFMQNRIFELLCLLAEKDVSFFSVLLFKNRYIRHLMAFESWYLEVLLHC
jgi:hypothetical protein